jgi:predicted MFS family arabinose efflux permease
VTLQQGTTNSNLDRAMLLVLAAAAGIAVANNYTNQAIPGLLQRDLELTPAMVSIIPAVTQLGNASGIILIAPLGDRLERKSLIIVTMVGLSAALMAAAIAPGFGSLIGTSVAIGFFAAVTQQLVPLAVHLASPSRRSRVLGVVTGGILVGILLARTFAGGVSDLWGWRAMYAIAATLTLATMALLAMRLPSVRPPADLNYFRLLQSMWTLLRTGASLRRALGIQALIFSAFMAFWGNLAIVLQGPPYHLGPTMVGLMALIGVGGVLISPIAGRLADKSGPKAVISAGAAVVVFGFAVLLLVQGSLAVIAAGALIIDLGAYGSQVANQAQVQALDSTALSRLNTLFMAAMILGGACGTGAGGLAYSVSGWTGTCAVAATLACAALLLSRGAWDSRQRAAHDKGAWA